MKRITRILPVAAVCLMISIPAAAVSGKPQLPLTFAVAPTQEGVTQETMRPGDVVELAVAASAQMDVSEVRIEAKLEGGAELVAGSLDWSGAAVKGEQKQLIFSIRVPERGMGRVTATVTFLQRGKKVMKRSVRYFLGVDKGESEQAPAYKMKKDAQGRKIIEY